MVQDVSKRVNCKLNQLTDHLIEFFHLPEVEDDTIWENERNMVFNLSFNDNI